MRGGHRLAFPSKGCSCSARVGSWSRASWLSAEPGLLAPPPLPPHKDNVEPGLAGVRPQLAKHLSEPVICFMNNRKRFPACSLRSEENTELKRKNRMTVTPNTKETLSECFVTKAIRHLFISSSWQRCLSGRQQKTPLNKPSLGYLRLPPRRFCPQLFYLLLVRYFFFR